MKFLLASLKTLTNSKNCSESCIKFLFRLSLLSLVDFFQCTFMADLGTIFRDHRWAFKKLFQTQGTIRKPEQSL